jgi:hypothetical protein
MSDEIPRTFEGEMRLAGYELRLHKSPIDVKRKHLLYSYGENLGPPESEKERVARKQLDIWKGSGVEEKTNG